MANWDYCTVDEAVRRIDSGEWQLPVIQRDFVWPKEKITLLFDTLLKKDPFGGIMSYVEESGSRPLFAHRRFSKNGVTSNSINDLAKIISDRIVIIDGQQRLQSMYIALRGDLHGEVLYFDVLNPLNADEFHFEFSNDHLKLPRENVFDDGSRAPCKWIALHTVNEEYQRRRDSERLSKRIFELLEITEDGLRDIVRSNISALCTSIFTEQSIGIAKLYLDTDEPEVHRRMRMVELFRRLNDGGTRLSGMDLVASQIRAFNWEMESKLRRITEEYTDINYDADSFIKLALVIGGKPRGDIDTFIESDAAFLTSNYERIEASLKGYISFLKFSGLYQYIKTKKNRIAGYIVATYLFHSVLSTEDIANYFDNYDKDSSTFLKIRKWLYISLLNGYFSRGCGWIPEKTGLERLSQIASENSGNDFPVNDLLFCYQAYPRLTYRLPNKDEPLSVFDRETIFKMLYGDSYRLREEDIDHIHPRSIIQEKYPLLTNVVENYQLLDFETNRNDKRAKPFSDWFNGSINKNAQREYLERHFIPEDRALWELEAFPQFISARRELLCQRLRELIE